jgi:2,4-dienoyl-CoA reductase-like NADH-dependent reductase (Old Yellow Enzyme family)
VAALFTPIRIRDLEIRNRIFVSPMCQYSAHNGVPDHWHFVHLGSRAVGGAGLVMAEATAVCPEGRISPGDTGIWSDEQIIAFAEITRFLREQGATPAIQLAHAGRKASVSAPWEGGHALSKEEGGWEPLAPSAIAFSPKMKMPREMSAPMIHEVIVQFTEAARRSLQAGFQVVEIHMAHGYLLHEFLSPLSNHRQDLYGGDFENRIRLPLAVAETVRKIWPREWPVFVRISATDWAEGGWDLAQSVEFAKRLKKIGVDLIDCSSGGLVAHQRIPVGPGYQVGFAEEIRKKTGLLTGAVGLITEAEQAENILTAGQADAIFMARELLRDPYWPLRAAEKLKVDVTWPKQYERAKR